jgi:oxygen-independent coproporphyrinogen-3 oxidase
MIPALAKEIVDEQKYLAGETIHTIYFGGGTPSILEESDIRLLLDTIRHHYSVSEQAEITLEANPDDIHPDKLKAWKAAGINRLSIGVQSFFEEELRWMNRAHNARQAIQCIEWSQQEGLTNLSIDLIYGSPLLTDEMWQQNVERATYFQIPHLSCYALTVEEKTPLFKQIQKHQVVDVDSDKQARQFLMLMQWLREKGYEHYEVSNFALPNFRSQHNSSYWKGEKYLGIGPSAHSYNGIERRWNIANNQVYIKNTLESHPKRETEVLTSIQRLNELIMISLRTKEGLDLDRLEKGWGREQRAKIARELEKYRKAGLVDVHHERAQLTDEGMLRADGIASDLFVLV